MAQSGSASALGAEGRGFESLCPDTFSTKGYYGCLGREAAYLTYYLRIRDHLEVYPSDEALFRGGVVAPEACALVRAASPPPEDAAFFQ